MADLLACNLEELAVGVHVGAKKPGFSYRKTSLAAEKHL